MKDGFVRDPSNPGAVINTDIRGLKAYKLQKQKNKQISELHDKVTQIDDLQQQVAEIKDILKTIAEKIA